MILWFVIGIICAICAWLIDSATPIKPGTEWFAFVLTVLVIVAWPVWLALAIIFSIFNYRQRKFKEREDGK